jgi:uncharacterized protein (DUF1015 family)
MEDCWTPLRKKLWSFMPKLREYCTVLASLQDLGVYCHVYCCRPAGTQVGILAALDVEDCINNLVKRHEKCIPAHEKPLTQRMKQYQSLYVDPVMVMYRQDKAIDDLLCQIMSLDEPIEVGDDDAKDCRHLLWCIHDRSIIASCQLAFANIEHLYIADGHHRTEDACKAYQSYGSSSSAKSTVGTLRRKDQPAFSSSKYLTALLYADTQLNVLSFNRCIKSFGCGVSCEQFILEAEKAFDVVAISLDEAKEIEYAQQQGLSAGNCILMYLNKQWYSLTLRRTVDMIEGNCDDKLINHLEDIDAQILVDKLFNPVLKLHYPESEKNMIYIDGRKGKAEVQRLVDAGEAAAGFVVRRVCTRRIMSLADANHLLPPKVRYFVEYIFS